MDYYRRVFYNLALYKYIFIRTICEFFFWLNTKKKIQIDRIKRKGHGKKNTEDFFFFF